MALLRRLEPPSLAMLLCVGSVGFVILAHLAVIFWLSVIEGSPGAAVHSYGWKNYQEVFTDSRTGDVLVNTLGFSVGSLVVALIFGLPAAWLVERTDLRAKTLLYTLMTIGMLIPGFAAAMGWVHGLNLAPLAFIMTAAVFRAMNPSLEEAAQTSGANWLRTMWRVTLPLALPGIMAASIYIFTIGFAAFDVPAIIGWSNRVFTFSTFLCLLIRPQDVLPRYGVATALSTMVMALAAAMSWWYGLMQKRSRQFAVVTGKADRPRIIKLGPMAYPVWGFLRLSFTLSTLLPISLLGWSLLLPF